MEGGVIYALPFTEPSTWLSALSSCEDRIRWCEILRCRYPIQINIRGRDVYVPCGHCAWCLSRKRDEWFFRLKYEASRHICQSFVTLTYRDEDLPLVPNFDTGELVPSVSVRDIQLYHKRLRKQIDFRFMICSEYGPKTHRPHYHGVYFHDRPFDFAKEWDKGDNNSQYPAKPGSYKYITKYMLKGSNVPEGAAPNFRLMSRRPGIGDGFEYKGTPYVLTENGVRCAVPRFYSRKYEASLSDKLRDVLAQSKLDYLTSVDQHSSFHHTYDMLVADGSLDPSYSFESWLSDLYRKDFDSQIKINQK